jgi:uncharacterized protein
MGYQTPVTFMNRGGLRLFGVVHTPSDAPTGAPTVLLLSPGVKMRVGPQGLYGLMADAFSQLGVSVFRFDYHGLGDSEGTLPERELRDVYNRIESGRYVDDTIDAMDWLQRTYGTRRFVLGGLCGGAVTGLLTGERDSRVEGLLALGMTPVLSASSNEASRYMTTGQLQLSQKKYLKRVLSPQAWFRLLTLRADNQLIRRMASQWVRKLLWLPPAASLATLPGNDNANPIIPPAFIAMLSRRCPMLFVYGGSDRLRWEFEEKLLSRHHDRLAALPQTFEVHVVESANHVLTLREWQLEMLEVSCRWLQSHFGGHLGVLPNQNNAMSTVSGSS